MSPLKATSKRVVVPCVGEVQHASRFGFLGLRLGGDGVWRFDLERSVRADGRAGDERPFDVDGLTDGHQLDVGWRLGNERCRRGLEQHGDDRGWRW
jgi:hypothetical protein